MALDNNTNGRDVIDKRRQSRSLSSYIDKAMGYIPYVNSVINDCDVILNNTRTANKKDNFFDLGSDEKNRQKATDKNNEEFTRINAEATQSEQQKQEEYKFEERKREEEKKYESERKEEEQKHSTETKEYEQRHSEYEKELSRQKERELAATAYQLRGEDSTYKQIGTGLGLKEAEKNSVFNGHKEVFETIMAYNLSDKVFAGSIEREKQRIAETEKREREKLEREYEEQTEARRKETEEFHKRMRNASTLDDNGSGTTTFAGSTLTIGTYALNKEAIHNYSADSYANFSGKQYQTFEGRIDSQDTFDNAPNNGGGGSSPNPSGNNDSRHDYEDSKNRPNNGDEKLNKFDAVSTKNYRYREEAAANAARKAASTISNTVKRADLTDRAEDELANENNNFSTLNRNVGNVSESIVKTMVARTFVTHGKVAELDHILSSSKNHDLELQAISAKSADDFKKLLDQIGVKSVQKYGTDITQFSKKALREFAKRGTEEAKLVEAVARVRKASNTAGGTVTVNSLAGGVGKAAVGSMLIKRGDFFDGWTGVPGVGKFATHRFIARKLSKAVKKSQFAFNAGFSFARQGLGAYVVNGKTPLSARLGRMAATSLANRAGQATAGEAVKVGFKRAVNNNTTLRKASLKLSNVLKKKLKGKGLKKATQVTVAGTTKTVKNSIFNAYRRHLLNRWQKFATTKLGAKIAATFAGKAIGKALLAAAAASTGGLSIIIQVALSILSLTLCLVCSCGINDLFSNATIFTVNNEGQPISDPTDSAGAEVIYLFDAYLTRNYEHICRRGLEKSIQDAIEKKKDAASMSQREKFVVDFSKESAIEGRATELTSESAENPDQTVENWEYEESTKTITFDAGKVCVLKHQAEEVVSSSGLDISLPERYLIDTINGGEKLNYEIDMQDGLFAGVKIPEADAEQFLNQSGKVRAIERYVYDVESHNSIFYSDYDHTVLPDLKNIMAIENDASLADEKRSVASTTLNHVISPGSGEYTPFDNTPFENTKEIISMAIAAFQNQFVAGNVNEKVAITPTQFQVYCYAMWLSSHYISTDSLDSSIKTEELAESDSRLDNFRASWRQAMKSVSDFFTSGTWNLEERLREDMETMYLSSIRSFGEIKIASMGDVNAIEEDGVNLITPFNSFMYSPELFHYGLYKTTADEGIIDVTSETNLENGSFKPYKLPAGDAGSSLKVYSNDLSSGDDAYFDIASGQNQDTIVAAKLPILNLEKMATTSNWFKSTVGGKEDFAVKEYKMEEDYDETGSKTIYWTRTQNYKYFENKTTLASNDSVDAQYQNEKSFIFNDNYWIGYDDPTWIHMHGDGDYYFWESQNIPVDENYIKTDNDGLMGNDTLLNGVSGADALRYVFSTHFGTGDDINTLLDKKSDLKEEEEMLEKIFYNLFATNKGYDIEDKDYSNSEFETYDGSKKELTYDNNLLTDCGTQQAFAGSILLSRSDEETFKVRGNKNVLKNIFEQTNRSDNFIIGDRYDGSLKTRTFIDEFVLGRANLIDLDVVSTEGIYSLSAITGSSSIKVGNTDLPVYIVTSDFSDYDNLRERLKEVIKPYKRAMIIYVSYDDEYDGHNHEVAHVSCGDCEDQSEWRATHPDGQPMFDGDYPPSCNCQGLYPTKGSPRGCENVSVEGYYAGYKATVLMQIPQAEFCGFYLCGGHTQIALMPVILTMTGTKNLFNTELSKGLFEGVGLDAQKTFIGQNIENLDDLWDLSKARATSPDMYQLVKQNRLNAVESWTDNWKNKYRLNYTTLWTKSITKSEELLGIEELKDQYNPTSSLISDNAFLIINRTEEETDDLKTISNKYKNGLSKSFDPLAPVIKERDLGVIMNAVTKELAEKLDTGDGVYDAVPEGEIESEYTNRVNRVSRALSKVGKVGYSQANHDWCAWGSRYGGSSRYTPVATHNDLIYKTDCIGFTSWVVGLGMRQSIKEDGYYDDLKNPLQSFYGHNIEPAIDVDGVTIRQWTAGEVGELDNLKPGDILVRDEGNKHAMVYICKVDDLYYVVECTSRGGKLGPGGVTFAPKTAEYVSTYYPVYVDYDVYPTLDKDLEIDDSEETE